MTEIICRRVFCWEGDFEPDEDDLEFHLTYQGELRATRAGSPRGGRSHHLHDIRRHFHQQIRRLLSSTPHKERVGDLLPKFDREGFKFKALVAESNSLVCKLDIVMLRAANAGRSHADIDNRMKTLFDAMRIPANADELGQQSNNGKVVPGMDEDPFYCLLEDDALITHLTVSTGLLLDPVSGVPERDAVRLMISVTIRPFEVTLDNKHML